MPQSTNRLTNSQSSGVSTSTAAFGKGRITASIRRSNRRESLSSACSRDNRPSRYLNTELHPSMPITRDIMTSGTLRLNQVTAPVHGVWVAAPGLEAEARSARVANLARQARVTFDAEKPTIFFKTILSGLTKYATLLLQQMTTDPTATPWFLKPDAPANQPPSIAKTATVAANPVSGMTTTLSVLGADDGGESELTYTWSGSGPADVTFSVNGPNRAKNTTATFHSVGRYAFQVTIADAGGLTATSSIAVTVVRP